MNSPVTDATLTTGVWVVGERYVLRDAVDRVDTAPGAWLPLQGRPALDERLPRRGEYRVRLIVDQSPDPRTRTPTVWTPGERPGLADELVQLGRQDDAAIVAWVEEHGFVGVRADPREWCESLEEIRAALAHLGQARDLVDAIRQLKGDKLRAETERLLRLPTGFYTRVGQDRTYTDEDADRGRQDGVPKAEDQPMWGPNLARRFDIAVPAGERWPGVGAYIQALYALGTVLQAPLERFLRVQTTIVPTSDGMRLQGAIVAQGPLATAYLQTLDEASWPAITYAGSLPRIDWSTPRRCGHCGTTFRPKRRDQKWCRERCRWSASKAHHSSRS